MRHPSERQPDRVIACDFGAIACSFVVERVETLSKPGGAIPREESGPVVVAVDAEASAVAEVAKRNTASSVDAAASFPGCHHPERGTVDGAPEVEDGGAVWNGSLPAGWH